MPSTMSLKYENVVPEVGFDFFRAIFQVMFLLLYERVRVRVVVIDSFFRARAARNKHMVLL